MKAQSDHLLRVELHVHTHASHDSLMDPDQLIKKCDAIGIDRVAITDHDVIDTALEMKAKYPERVIVGEEIETSQGEILGYFMTEWVPGGLDPMETIKRLRSQGAVISIPHPFDSLRKPHFSLEQLESFIPCIDAVETFNARCISNAFNEQAKNFAKSQGLLETVGSDAHTFRELGKATLMMAEFFDAETLLVSLRSAEQITDKSSFLVHFSSRFAKFYKKIKLKENIH
jgi:predicted metal-dependent phosphoesterase TrpH